MFRDVSFVYQQRSERHPDSKLEVLQGERVAIVGPMEPARARLYDVDSGEILIAGADIRRVALDSLRSTVCYLPAQPILFHRSIASNLRIGRPDSTCDDLQRVLQLVGLTKYLDGFPGSLEEYIEPKRIKSFKRERQRVAIARSAPSPSGILILDETTSSLDPASEEAILRTIDQMLRTRPSS